MSTNTVPAVYQQCTNRQKQTKTSQKTVKTAKMTIGVLIVTGLPRLYQQCNNRLQVVNKNLAIANRSRVSLGRHVKIGTPMVIFAVLTVFCLFLTVFDDWYTVGTLLVQSW